MFVRICLIFYDNSYIVIHYYQHVYLHVNRLIINFNFSTKLPEFYLQEENLEKIIAEMG